MMHQLVSKPSFVLDGAFLLTTPSISVHHKPPKLSTTIFHFKKKILQIETLTLATATVLATITSNATEHPTHIRTTYLHHSLSLFQKTKKTKFTSVHQSKPPQQLTKPSPSSSQFSVQTTKALFKPPPPVRSSYLQPPYSTISSPVSSLQSPNQANVYAF